MFDHGSFRDPSGYVFHHENKIYRTVNESARSNYERFKDSRVLDELINEGWVIDTKEVDLSEFDSLDCSRVAYVLQHETIPYISYPYEWGFLALKEAAQFHLDLHLELLKKNFTLSDASAYNVQFVGSKPVFIDLLSIKPYQEGEYWLAHHQFCEQFLCPLVLRAKLGIPHNSWYRGNLEGISILDLARLLPKSAYLSKNILIHILLQAKLQNKSISKGLIDQDQLESEQTPVPVNKTDKKQLPVNAYSSLLQGLRKWISGLQPKDKRDISLWQNYSDINVYHEESAAVKRGFIEKFIASNRPSMVWDIGCNTGHYSELCLQHGVENVIGFDIDHNAIDSSFLRSREKNLAFQAIYFDGANPSPSQGWQQKERNGFLERTNADAIIALAFIHHLVIGKNIPINQLVDWLLSLANVGIIEFVSQDDLTVRHMLANRENIFSDYTQENFENLLSNKARITDIKEIPGTKRILYSYTR